MSYIKAVLFGFLTIIIASILFTVIISIIFTTIDINLAIQNKIIRYATYTICLLGGFISGRHLKRKVFYVALALSCLSIFIPYLLFATNDLFNLQIGQYLKWLIQTIVIICGTVIGSIGRS